MKRLIYSAHKIEKVSRPTFSLHYNSPKQNGSPASTSLSQVFKLLKATGQGVFKSIERDLDNKKFIIVWPDGKKEEYTEDFVSKHSAELVTDITRRVEKIENSRK